MRDEIRCRLTPANMFYAAKGGEAQALHGDSHSPRVVSLLRLLFACTSADYNIIRRRKATPLKAHTARRIATAQMAQETAHAHSPFPISHSPPAPEA